ncbi:MAG: pentapeptide repeat-containing protein [Thermoguttaceae bacterium]|nr:pentapeptide repeat-containing protein [Thermoguttaceae bacterium]
MTDARLTDVTASGLSGRQLAQTANFRQKRYVGLRLADANFEKYDFSNAFLTRCRFSKIDFTDADFTDAVLYDCEFRDVEVLTLEQLKSTWNWKSNSLDLASFDDALQAQIKTALAESQLEEAQYLANARRAETAAAFGLSPLKSPASSSLYRRYVPSNSTFDAIPHFRVASIERRYRADANGDALVSQRLNPENAIVIQAPRPPQERFVVELVGDDLRTATLQIEYFPTAKSCRDRLLDVLAEDGEKRWKLDAKKSVLDDVCFVATGDALTSRFLFTWNGAIYALDFNDKTSPQEAEAVYRYIAQPSGVAGSLKLNRPDIDPR